MRMRIWRNDVIQNSVGIVGNGDQRRKELTITGYTKYHRVPKIMNCVFLTSNAVTYLDIDVIQNSFEKADERLNELRTMG